MLFSFSFSQFQFLFDLFTKVKDLRPVGFLELVRLKYPEVSFFWVMMDSRMLPVQLLSQLLHVGVLTSVRR